MTRPLPYKQALLLEGFIRSHGQAAYKRRYKNEAQFCHSFTCSLAAHFAHNSRGKATLYATQPLSGGHH